MLSEAELLILKRMQRMQNYKSFDRIADEILYHRYRTIEDLFPSSFMYHAIRRDLAEVWFTL